MTKKEKATQIQSAINADRAAAKALATGTAAGRSTAELMRRIADAHRASARVGESA